jgi:hypothetical protein
MLKRIRRMIKKMKRRKNKVTQENKKKRAMKKEDEKIGKQSHLHIYNVQKMIAIHYFN